MSEKKTKWEQLEDYQQFVVDGFAAFYTQKEIAQALEQEFVDENGKPRRLSAATLRNYQIRWANLIKDRREELALSDIPILDPMIRFRWLQEVIEDAKAGSPVTDRRTGEIVGYQVKHDAVIKGIDLANKMTNYYKEAGKGDDIDRAELKRAAEELKAALQQNNPEAKEDDINNAVVQRLGDAAREFLM